MTLVSEVVPSLGLLKFAMWFAMVIVLASDEQNTLQEYLLREPLIQR